MKNWILVVLVMATLGLVFFFLNKGEKSNNRPDGTEIEPLSFEGKIMRGLDLTLEAIKGKIQSTRPKVYTVTTDEPGYAGEDRPENEKMISYANPNGTSSFTAELKKYRGLFNHVEN